MLGEDETSAGPGGMSVDWMRKMLQAMEMVDSAESSWTDNTSDLTRDGPEGVSVAAK